MGRPLRACIVIVFLLAAARGARAQSATATARLSGQVSGAISLSASEARALGGEARASTSDTDATTVAISISGSGDAVTRVNIPLRLRSNVGYRLRASVLSSSEPAVRLSVANVAATGKLVRANAVEGIRLGEALAAARDGRADFVTVRNASPQLFLLAGPPASTAGTFTSPDNAIEIVLSVEVRPRPTGEPWSTRLTISASPHAGQ